MMVLPDYGPRFVPLERLTSGVMSEAWLAEDRETGVRVVIKRPAAGLAASSGRAAIVREARALGRLDHPCIPAVVASYELEGEPILAVEWIDGETLATLRGRSADELLPALIGVAEALEHAHARGVIHRDVKPANVIIDPSGRTHLIDFGIAADPADGERWPVGGGTPGYASPQQLAGDKPDPRDDLWSFGALVADLLAGFPPGGEEPVTIPPADPEVPTDQRSVRLSSPELEDLMTRLRSPRPADRPLGFAGVIQELQTIRDQLTIQTRPPAETPVVDTPGSPPGPPMLPITVHPPRSAPTAPGGSRVWLAGGVGCLVLTLGMALFTVFVLLPRWVARPEAPETSVVKETLEAVPASDESGAVARRLRQADEKWEGLCGRSVGRWAGPQSREVDELLAQAHDLLDDGAVVRAAETAEAVLVRIDGLFAEAGTVAAEAVGRGGVALAEGRPQDAADHFRYALEVEPGGKEARVGLDRAAALDEALRAIERGAARERSGDVDGAESEFRRARDLAPWFPEGGRALARLTNGRRDASYVEIVSQALTALDAGRWQDAEEALLRAEKLRPEAPEVRDGLQRLEAGRRSELITELEQLAARHEREESWAAAVSAYERMLELVPASLSAQNGVRRAKERDELDQKLRGHLSHPDRLTDKKARIDAEGVLQEADKIGFLGPRLEQQVSRLETLVEQMSTPVAVEIVSDGETEVTIYKVGRLGRFENRVVQIPPGTYTVVGTRRGFRDIRLTLEVPVGRVPGSIAVRCKESL